jgi:CheY-like chemotaxis protein
MSSRLWTYRKHTGEAESYDLSEQSNHIATALIVTTDKNLNSLLADALRTVAIAAESCESALECFEVVKHKRFEAAFIDFSNEPTAIDAVRSSPSSRTALIIAMTVNEEQSAEAFARGVHFVLQQPISRSIVDGIIRAAYGLIIRERRRYFRCPIDVTILAHRRTEGIWRGRAANVSEGGVCIFAPVALATGEPLELQFMLPSSTIEISADCEVLWVDESGGRAKAAPYWI